MISFVFERFGQISDTRESPVSILSNIRGMKRTIRLRLKNLNISYSNVEMVFDFRKLNNENNCTYTKSMFVFLTKTYLNFK